MQSVLPEVSAVAAQVEAAEVAGHRMPIPDVGGSNDEVWEGGGRRYRTEKVVGNGAFGIVWRAREEGSSTVVAIKKVVLDRRYHNRELEMMKGLEHECVIKLHHSFEKP